MKYFSTALLFTLLITLSQAQPHPFIRVQEQHSYKQDSHYYFNHIERRKMKQVHFVIDKTDLAFVNEQLLMEISLCGSQ